MPLALAEGGTHASPPASVYAQLPAGLRRDKTPRQGRVESRFFNDKKRVFVQTTVREN